MKDWILYCQTSNQWQLRILYYTMFFKEICAKKFLINLWRNKWHSPREIKLREIKSITNNGLKFTRNKDVLLTWFRIWHTWHTHKHLTNRQLYKHNNTWDWNHCQTFTIRMPKEDQKPIYQIISTNVSIINHRINLTH